MKIENEYYPDSKVYVEAVIVTIETIEEAFKLINDSQMNIFLANSHADAMFLITSELIGTEIIVRVEKFGTSFMPEDIALIERMFKKGEQ